MKIIHASDLHLGVTTHSGNRRDPATGLNVRVADFAARWLDCCRRAVFESVDALLFTGDAFHYREPDAASLDVFARGVKLVADAGIQVVLLTGNHDVSATAGRAHALSVFQALDVPHVHVVDRPQLLWLPTHNDVLLVAGLPWPAKGWTADYAKGANLAERDALLGAYLEMEIAKLAQQARNWRTKYTEDPPLSTVLMAHIGVSEAQASGEAGMMLGREVQLPLAVFRKHADAFDYVALGHYHRCQMWPREKGLDGAPWIAYAGSMERVDFGEAAEQKGWLEVDLAGPVIGQCQGVTTAARRMVRSAVDCREASDPTAHTLATIAGCGDLTDCIVGLDVRLRTDQAERFRDGDVARALAAAWYVAPVGKTVERPARLRLGHDVAEIAALTPEQALMRWLDLQQALPEARRAELLETGTALMRAVEQEGGN